MPDFDKEKNKLLALAVFVMQYCDAYYELSVVYVLPVTSAWIQVFIYSFTCLKLIEIQQPCWLLFTTIKSVAFVIAFWQGQITVFTRLGCWHVYNVVS